MFRPSGTTVDRPERRWGGVGNVAYGWIGESAASAVADPAERAERAPSLVVSTAHSTLGAVRRRQIRVGEVTVLLAPGSPGWVREAVVDEIDLGAHLAAELDLAGRGRRGRRPGRRWAGTLPVARYAALPDAPTRTTPTPLARAAGCPAELVRSLASPVALGRVEVVRRDGAARPSGPTTVVTDELGLGRRRRRRVVDGAPGRPGRRRDRPRQPGGGGGDAGRHGSRGGGLLMSRAGEGGGGDRRRPGDDNSAASCARSSTGRSARSRR